MGYAAPASTAQYRFNVYIGDTDGGTPASRGTAGYYSDDDADGYPFIVIAARTLEQPNQAALTAAHELFHAMQRETGAYRANDQGSWYFEATAVWAENEVYPDDPDYADKLHAWAFLPELPIHYFREPDGELDGLHQYGAFVFVRHLTEIEADRELVRRSWQEAGEAADPLAVIDGLLAEGGRDVESAFFEFAARAATWDWEHEDWFEDEIDGRGGWGSRDAHRPTDEVPLASDDWRYPPDEYLPATYGVNYWELGNLPGAVTVDFDGHPDPTWRVFVASERRDEHTRVEVPITDGEGSARIEDLDRADEAWLVVAATDAFIDYGDTWGYRLRVRYADPIDTGVEDTDEEAPKACGCAIGSGTAGSWGVLVSLCAATARRRSRSR
jgi:hypothetical protein